MSKTKKTKKVGSRFKVTIGAVSVLGLVGGWNLIGRMEKAAIVDSAPSEEIVIPTPTAAPASVTPWPTLQPLAEMPRVGIKPLPTLSTAGLTAAEDDEAIQAGQETAGSLAVSAMPSVAALPTLAPLPAMPEYVPPPPPPPRPESVASASGGGGGSGGGNKSKGS